MDSLPDRLERSFAELSNSAQARRNARICMEHLGLCGAPPEPMQRTGDRHGLTRESVRQIVRRNLEALQAGEGAAGGAHSALRELAATILAIAPATRGRILAAAEPTLALGSALRAEGFALEGYLRLLHRLGLDQGRLASGELLGVTVIEPIGSGIVARARAALKAARRLSRHNGAVQLESITAGERTALPALLEAVIAEAPSAARVPVADWASVGLDRRNRLLEVFAHVLEHYGSVERADLQRALARRFRKAAREGVTALPPQPVVEWLAEYTGVARLDGELVLPGTQCARWQGLQRPSPMEARLLETLRAAPTGRLREKVLEEALVAGRSKASYAFAIALNYSPLIVREPEVRGVYRPLAGHP